LVFDLIGNPPGATSVASIGNVQVSQTPISETFTTEALPGPIGAPAGITSGDVDGDGHADLVVADSGLNQLLVYNGDCTGNFTRSSSAPARCGAGAAAIAAAPLGAGAGQDGVAVAFVGWGSVLPPLVLDTPPPQATLVSPAPDQVLITDVNALRIQF